MRCEEALQQLPDFTLGSLEEEEQHTIRAHLRGCGSCRAEADGLDQGLASFASGHVVEPPAELEDRVLGVLQEEWDESYQWSPSGRLRRWLRWTPVAAVSIALVGLAAWGSVAQMNANGARADATAYETFLGVLGGKDVRVAELHAVQGGSRVGSVVLYDGRTERSWVVVLVRAPAFSGKEVTALISSGWGTPIELFPMEVDENGDGATWMVTSDDISDYNEIRLTDRSGRVLAEGASLEIEGSH